MVGNKVLLTAGHLIRHTSLDIGPKEIRVILRYDTTCTSISDLGDVATYYHPKSWVFSANYYTENENSNYDWCYMVMHDDIGKTYTGWYGIGTTASAITDKAIYVTGYPDYTGERYHQYKSSGIMNSVSDFRVSHTCSTRGGQSGSPLYTENHVVWAVHTAGGASSNYGVRIIGDLYTLLINKKEETD